MPPKLRKKQNRKKGNGVDSDSSSSPEDQAHQRTMEIITKLSQKYLSTGQSSSKKTPENGYEGDEENSTGSSTSSIGSPYDFEDEPMSEDTMSTSSTITGRNTKKSKKTSGKNQSQQKNKKLKNLTPESGNHSKQIPACEKEKSSKVKSVKKSPSISASEKTKNKSVSFQNISDAEEKLKFPKTPVPKSPIVALEKLDLQMVEESQRQLRKRKSETVVTQNPKVTKKDLKDNCKIDKKVNNTSIHGRIVPEMVQDMSTPNEILRTKALRKSGNDSCFGFEDIRRTSLPVSPVCKLPITPLSDYASMDTFSHDVTMEDSSQKSKPSSPTLFSMDEDDDLQVNKSFQKSYKPRKKQLTKKQQAAKSNEWTQQIEKMTVEFQAIESFELSIEQD